MVACITCRYRNKRVLRGKVGQGGTLGWRQHASQAGACVWGCRPAIARGRYSHIRGFHGRLSTAPD